MQVAATLFGSAHAVSRLSLGFCCLASTALLLYPLPITPLHLLDLAAQHYPLQADLDAAAQRVLRAGAFIQGPDVASFAQELGAYLGGAHVVPCANGTDALQLALMSLNLAPGAEVIVPAFTYVATVEAAAVLGLTPVLVDACPGTFNLNPAAVEAALTPRTGAIVAVHLFGQCAELEALQALAQRHGVALIEDNAQALGAAYTMHTGETRLAGTVGDVGTTSFFPSKNLGGFGDGGALMTREVARATYLYQLANHGQSHKYHHQHVGINSRLDTLQAALLRVKLPYLNQWNAARQQLAAQYDALLAQVPGLLPPARDPRSTHVFNQYTITLATETQRDGLQQHLQRWGVPTIIYYPQPVHLQPAYAYLGYRRGQFPVAEELCRTVLALPMQPMLTAEQVAYVAEAISAFAG